MLGYRPNWTPVLVRTPEDLDEQMRVHGEDFVHELDEYVDPRMVTFLAGTNQMDTALAVLNSSLRSAPKFVLLQGVLDPDGQIQFQGFGLDSATFADQIRKAHNGDEAALNWFEAIQVDRVLTAFAEVAGNTLVAEADFRLARWRDQAEALIEAATMKADDADFDTQVRLLFTARANLQAIRE